MMRNEERECCSLCGNEIRTSDNTELLDGWICPDCRSLLSPWYPLDDLDCAEAEEIRRQLDGRARNRKLLKSFHPTRKFGFSPLILVDDDARTFVVTDSRDLEKANPDIFRIQDVDYCLVEPKESREEIGPRRYRYSYTFKVDIGVDHDYIDEITYPLNPEPLDYESSEKGFLGIGGFDPEGQPDYDELSALAQKIENVLTDDDDGTDDEKYAVRPGEFGGRDKAGQGDPLVDENGRYQEGRVVICPWCGSRTTLDKSFVCSHCGGPL